MSKLGYSKEKTVSHAGKVSHDRRAPSPATANHAGRAIFRRHAHLQRFAQSAGLSTDQLAFRLMLTPARIADLLSGRAPISNELATHIEEMLQLPASWLDQGSSLDRGASPMIDSVERSMSAPAPSPLAAPADKKQINENRRLNLSMLTVERGTKHRLAQLASTSGSRISLMTSARKPVSDPFAFAIEDGLGLPRGWLDQIHAPDTVPAQVWQALGADASSPSAPAHSVRQPLAPRRAQTSPPASAIPASPTPAPAPAPLRVAAPPTSTRSAEADAALSPTGLFDKSAGQCGPIAEALVKTILNLSANDKLSEARAFELLGKLIAESSSLQR